MKTGPSICVLLGTSFICQNEYKKVMRFARLTNDKPCHICGIVGQMFTDEKSYRGISICVAKKMTMATDLAHEICHAFATCCL